MSNDHSSVLLTTEHVAAKRTRKRELERMSVEIQDELAVLNRWLDAAAIVIGDEQSDGDEDGSGGNLMGAIVRIVGASQEPITKGELKRQLQSDGFADTRLQNYFYTAISRLAKRRVIVKMDDGRIARSTATPS